MLVTAYILYSILVQDTHSHVQPRIVTYRHWNYIPSIKTTYSIQSISTSLIQDYYIFFIFKVFYYFSSFFTTLWYFIMTFIILDRASRRTIITPIFVVFFIYHYSDILIYYVCTRISFHYLHTTSLVLVIITYIFMYFH